MIVMTFLINVAVGTSAIWMGLCGAPEGETENALYWLIEFIVTSCQCEDNVSRQRTGKRRGLTVIVSAKMSTQTAGSQSERPSRTFARMMDAHRGSWETYAPGNHMMHAE